MIVSDTSALLAIVFGEPDYATYAAALRENVVQLSAATLTESLLVAEGRQGPEAVAELQRLIEATVDSVVVYDRPHALAAHAAWRRFGEGRHPAKLNFGDCMAYATAKLAGVPLLFKGDDFTQTDIASAL